MAQYLLSLYQPDGGPPPPEVLEPIMSDLAALNAEMQAAGVWVTAVGLHPPSAAAVVRSTRGGRTLVTDGPFTEAKEHLGGFTIVTAPDRDGALEWARRLAEVTTLPVEVRTIA